MPLAPGATLGPYDIIAPISAGGMGEVYRARDPRLQRDVAVKILKTDGPIDDTTRDRFTREARSVAALNHPHICAVYDVGVHSGTDYIVMELVDGETLASRLAAGPLSLADALRYARQIASALGAVHRAGIIHRDLKPGNIMLTRAGAKLLDFGIAKSAAPPTAAGAMTATADTNLSMPGVVMGTWPYTSPEQILGRPVGPATDVFAFGVVLHEMLAGRRPFEGDSAPQIMAAILERDAPPLSTAAPHVPRDLQRVVEKCLAKPAELRWQSMSDLADTLRWIEDDLGRPGDAAPASGSARRLPALLIAVGVAAVGLAAGLWFRPGTAPSSPAPVVRFAIAPSDLDTSGPFAPEISPGGRQLAFVARPRAGGPAGVYVHDLTSGSTRRVEGTDGAASPFWSGDGRSVGFVARGRLMRTEVAGGSPRAIVDVQDSFVGAAWSRDDVIAVSLRYGFYRVPAGGGTPTQVTTLDRSRQENSHRWPQFLPDGQRFLFVARSGRPDRHSAYVGFLDGRPPVRLMEANAQVRYSTSGHLVYVQDSTLVARAIDASTLTFAGDPIPIADGVGAQGTGLRARFSLSDTGVLVHQALDSPRLQLRWYDRTGHAVGPLGAADRITNFRLSPDATHVVIDLEDNPRGGRSVWLVDVATGSRNRVTFGESDDWQPVWSRDGERILFGSYRNGPLDLYQRPASGATPDSVILASEVQKIPSDWSQDGSIVLVTENTAERRGDVVAVSIATGARTVIAATEAVEERGRFSPDDRWVAYGSDESGRVQVYVQPFPPTGAKWQVTVDGGTEPTWRGDGREIYYLDPERGIMAVAVETTPAFRHAAPVLLVPTRSAVIGGGDSAFDGTQDGRRFLIRERAEQSDLAVPMQVILNWPTLLGAGRSTRGRSR